MEYRYKLTTNGRSAMAACLALEKPPKITRVAFGSGKVAEDVNLADVHELLAYVSDGAVSERRHVRDRFYLTIQYANEKHKDVKMFLLSEFIVYIEDPETEAETDLLYGTLGDYRQPIPAYNPAFPPSVFNFPLELILSDELNVNVSAPAGLVTYDELLWAVAHLAARVDRKNLTIPAEGWEQDDETGGAYALRRDIRQDGVTADMVPFIHLSPASGSIARDCGLSGTAKTMDGALRVYAQTAPTNPIEAEVTLLRVSAGAASFPGGEFQLTLPPATAERIGGVKIGNGVTVQPDGTISVDGLKALEGVIAPDGSAEEMLDKVFGGDGEEHQI